MDKFASENLILLEFLVDSLSLEQEVQEKLNAINGDVCVSFRFFDNAPLEMCENDFAVQKKACICPEEEERQTKNGKSCLFSCTPEQIEDAMRSFDISVVVFKRTKPGILPDKITVGETWVSVSEVFKEIVDGVMKSPEGTPAVRVLKDTFKLASASGEPVGDITVYIRMSCFGKLIVTQFQMNLQDNSVEFKAKEGHYMFKYSKRGEGEGCPPSCGKQGQDEINSCPYQGAPPTPYPIQPSPYNQAPSYPQASPYTQAPSYAQAPPISYPQPALAYPYQDMYQPQPQQDQCSQLQSQLNGQGCPMQSYPCCCLTNYPYNRPDPQQQSAVDPNDPSGEYQEIGAEMGANRLVIRVHKQSAKIETADPNPAASSSSCTCGAPKQPCDPNAPFCLKVGGSPNARNNVTVTPPSAQQPDLSKPLTICGLDQEKFVLKIAKRSEKENKKNKLELELCTPRGQDSKPPPKLESRDAQCEEVEDGEKKAGKGKGAKGAKGGKKKGKGKK